MRINATLSFLCVAALLSTACTNEHSNQESPNPESAITEILIENLYRDSLALAPNVEVVVSYLEVPANSTLPLHWHPGEEFGYLIKGSGIVTLEDKSTIALTEGSFFNVPFKDVHSFSTSEESVTAVVFRVHQKGEPDRVLVD